MLLGWGGLDPHAGVEESVVRVSELRCRHARRCPLGFAERIEDAVARRDHECALARKVIGRAVIRVLLFMPYRDRNPASASVRVSTVLKGVSEPQGVTCVQRPCRSNFAAERVVAANE